MGETEIKAQQPNIKNNLILLLLFDSNTGVPSAAEDVGITTKRLASFLKYMFKERRRKMEEQETSTLTVIGWPFLYKKSSFSYVHIQSQN